MTKPRHLQNALEMNFEDFVSWAVSEVVFGIGKGNDLREIMFKIVDHAARNETFGRGSKSK
jgi:hypothetical protein